MLSKTTPLMRQHVEGCKDDGKFRHPANAYAFKHFDNRYTKFVNEPLNVRFYLANDEFNPCGDMSIQ